MAGTLTTPQAIRKVLEEKSPLGASEIAERVIPLVKGLKGKTPKATVAAVLYTQAKKPDGLVVRVEKGFKLNPKAATTKTAKAETSKREPGQSAAVTKGAVVLKDGNDEVKSDPKPGAKAA